MTQGERRLQVHEVRDGRQRPVELVRRQPSRSPRCCGTWSATSPPACQPPGCYARPAEDLPFDDDSFDVAVSTLVLCGVDDQPRALRELRPGGRLLFIEHVRSDDPGAARLQDRLNWLSRLVVCCDWHRPTLESIRAAGFTVAQVEHMELPKVPPFVRPAIMGSATAPVAAPRVYRDGDRPAPEPIPDRRRSE
jgi:SAM-dependent methyltransferase